MEFEEEVSDMTAYAASLVTKGEAKGIAQGEDNIVEVIMRLKSGETKEKLVSSGFQETTIEKALRLLSQLQ